MTRPTVRGLDVVTTLADFALITYAVEPERLAALLPNGFAPDVRTLDDGRCVALVSAVPFRDLDFRFAFFPWARFRMGQTNYRAYVRYRGRPCVWFFGTTLTRPWVFVPRWFWRLPWHGAKMRFDVGWQGGENTHYRLSTQAAWGSAEVELRGSSESMGRLDGFADEEETALILTHPLEGYFRRTDGMVGTYSVWHERLRPHRGHWVRGGFSVFEALGLVAPDAVPHSVLLQREIEFLVFLPPQVLAG